MTVMFTSCTKNLVPITQEMVKEYGWEERELKKIQFYTSEDIILYKLKDASKVDIEKGKIQYETDKNVKEILIKKNTPGVLVYFPKEDRWGISFEKGNSYYLTFGPHPKMGDRFVLLASEWTDSRGLVTYNGDNYSVPTKNADAILLVDTKNIKELAVDRRKAKGRKL